MHTYEGQRQKELSDLLCFVSSLMFFSVHLISIGEENIFLRVKLKGT